MNRAVIFMLSALFLAGLALAGSNHGAMGGDNTQAAGDHKCGESCPAHGKDVVKTEKDVTLAGKIQCMHCDLHKENKCRKVLVTADKTIYQFCPDTVKTADLNALSGKSVEVKGSVMVLKEGDPVLHVATIRAI
jgi:hypothetical protein